MSGITGRAFNVSGTGLNQYVLLVAETGRGKEGARSGVLRFVGYTKSGAWHDGDIPNQLPTVDEHMGPADIASGQALIKYLGTSRSFVAFVGEFGHTIERICHPRASASDVTLRKVLLDLFNLSGEHDVLHPTIYSDKANNTDAVDSPAFSLFGETSPQALYPHLSESMVALGLLPRFTPIVYEGPRTAQNPDAQRALPTGQTVRRFADLVARCAHLNARNAVVHVPLSRDAYDFAGPGGYVDSIADGIINAEAGVMAELWNRAHIKTLKLAALVAVGRDHAAPEISLPEAQWAFAVVQHGIEALARKFDAGEVGETTDEAKQEKVFVASVVRYLAEEYHKLPRLRATREMHADHIVPLSYLQQDLLQKSAFKKDRLGANVALKRTIQSFLDGGDLQELGRADLQSYGTRGKAYGIANAKRFTSEGSS
ncbi:hypothetical protein [Anianabacter salinae]|uniref:hypothetical protein n=1 Tax=Anianabacter salinae TaxID=2851023 RepID=UPI00225E0574|nr:hypothetical protein [Anianabacter salinae]MBV0910920.1 hypothetical protein [Anianabacter salinae]